MGRPWRWCLADIQAFVALGANLGDPARQVRQGLADLASLPQTRLMRHSCLYLSKPMGYLQQPDYINAVAALQTKLTPRKLLDRLLEIETRHGRTRDFKNAPRTLDLDLTAVVGWRGSWTWSAPDDLAMLGPSLSLLLPHPRALARAFVVEPLVALDARAVDLLSMIESCDEGAILNRLDR